MSGMVLSLAMACILAPPVETSAETTTHLYIKTTPPGAEVSVGGKKLGKSPGVYPVESGVQRIVIELDGHKAEKKELSIRAGRVTRLELKLKKDPASQVNRRDALKGKPLLFGPASEHILNFARKRVAKLLDLDTGQWTTIEEFGADDRETHRRVRETGVDLLGGVEGPGLGMLLFDASVKELADDPWDTITPAEVANDWHLKQNEPLPITMVAEIDPDKLPKTCMFETREGSLGVIQLVGKDEKGTGAKVRYKLVKPTSDESAWPRNIHIVIGPDPEDVSHLKVLDLASGSLLTPDGRDDLQFTARGKGDLFFHPVDHAMACLRGAKAKHLDGERSVVLSERAVPGSDATKYKLPPLPCRLLITTAEKKCFEVTVLSKTVASNHCGVAIEYKPVE